MKKVCEILKDVVLVPVGVAAFLAGVTLFVALLVKFAIMPMLNCIFWS